MTTRYEAFNEVTFEAYIKSAIDKAILKERMKKAARGKWEQPYSTLTDAMLYGLSLDDAEIQKVEATYRVFQVQGISVLVYGEKLGQALSYLMPRDREIILLYFFLQESVDEIACRFGIHPTTVRRHCKAAIRKMRDFLEDTT